MWSTVSGEDAPPERASGWGPGRTRPVLSRETPSPTSEGAFGRGVRPHRQLPFPPEEKHRLPGAIFITPAWPRPADWSVVASETWYLSSAWLTHSELRGTGDLDLSWGQPLAVGQSGLVLKGPSVVERPEVTVLLVRPCPAHLTYLNWRVGTPGGFSADLGTCHRKGHPTHEANKGSEWLYAPEIPGELL